MKKWPALMALVVLGTALAMSAQAVANISYSEARFILTALDEILPAALKGKGSESLERVWPQWLENLNAQIRGRLVRGDEDTLINFLFLGTSYTGQPRLAPTDFKPAPDQPPPNPALPLSMLPPRTQKILEGRTDDLVRALAAPKDNERLLFFQSLLAQKGLQSGQGGDPAKIRGYLVNNLLRVLNEAARYAATLDQAKRLGDASAEFAERSTLFQDRGLSLDTSLLPDFALEQSLAAMKEKKLLEPGSVRRVAIIGPGLDFIDKDGGYDFYTPQTIQPFALVDSLARLGLARPDHLYLTTLDVSPRLNEHLNRARQRASKGSRYTVKLPRAAKVPWDQLYLRYWETFGDQIGSVSASAGGAAMAEIALRSVDIRPEVVELISPVDLNIVTQHLVLPAAERFDLIIATNIFVYYDIFQQSLALKNVESMLRPGGLLLSNNALLELPDSKIRSVGYLSVVYSSRPADGDTIVWYRRNSD